jgi:hypothetical protein
MVKAKWMTVQDMKNAVLDGVKNMTEAATYGINNPRREAMAEAIKKVQDGTWKKNFLASIEKWFKNVQIPLDQWKKLCNDMASFYESNARSYGADNWEAFEEQMMPKMDGIVQTFLDSDKGREAYKTMWTAIEQAAKEVKA